VKLKVWVTDSDDNADDPVDGLVQLLRLTPARKESVSSWTTINVYGQRSYYKTRLVGRIIQSLIFTLFV